MEKEKSGEWFEDWFDSPYYHILYAHRDKQDASLFIDNLLRKLAPGPDARILDVACGKGRHSIYLADKGYELTGIDLSENSIREASYHEHSRLSFFVHDMRKPFRYNYFDFAFNFFTSFGYFKCNEDNYHALSAIGSSLKPDGKLVIDFLNAVNVIRNLSHEEIVMKNGIEFHITRGYRDKYIYKDIRFEDEGKKYFHTERVQALMLNDFVELMTRAGLRITNIFGDYKLHGFDEKESPRLILIACRN